MQRALVEERGRGVDDDLQPAPGLHQPLELLVASKRRGQSGEELVGGQLRLRLVVVDVVVDDDPALGRLPGLAGAQNDADRLVLQLLAHELDKLQPRPFRLHDDVKQDDGHVRIRTEELACFRRGARRQKIQTAPMQLEVLQHEARAGVDGLVVVDDRHLPARQLWRCRRDLVLDQRYEIGLFGHPTAPCRKPERSFTRCAAKEKGLVQRSGRAGVTRQ